MKEKGRRLFFFDLILALLALFVDQFTKRLAVERLKGQESIPLIPGALELRYLENRGAAFGMLQNQKTLFLIMTVFVLLAAVFILWNMPSQRRYRTLHLMGAFLMAGALGNFIDRASQNYVVDFIYIRLIDFPIFNVADMYVSFVCVAGIFVIFFGPYREEDFAFLKTAAEKLMFWRK